MAENLIRLSEVMRRVPHSRSTIYLKVARKEFPQPVSLGARAVAVPDDWAPYHLRPWTVSSRSSGAGGGAWLVAGSL